MAQITDRYVLADIQGKVTAAGSEHECASNRRSPDEFAINKALNVLQYWITIVGSLTQCRVGIGTQQHRIRTVDADETQLAHRPGNHFGISAYFDRKRQDRIAGPPANAADAGRGVAFKDCPILREGQKPCSIFCWLPIRIVGTTLHVIDLLPIEFEWHTGLGAFALIASQY